MVDILELNPGDRVQIVSEWGGGCYPNPDGGMDHWLGQIMTVKTIVNEFPDPYVHMWEDFEEWRPNGWNWYGPAIACKIDEGSYDIDDLSCLFE